MTSTRTPARVFPPGDFIREEIEARGMTQQDLADAMGRPLAAINEIINAKRKVTAKTARELETALGVSARFWMNLETSYQLSLAPKATAAGEAAKIYEFGPIKEMQRRGWIPKTSVVSEMRSTVTEFFSVTEIGDRPQIAAAFRQSAEEINMSHCAWCIMCLRKAKQVSAKPFDRSRMDSLREELRGMSAFADEIRRVPMVLADYGIRLVIVKHLTSTKIDGATLWLDPEAQTKPVIAMSLRHGRIDYFWHTLCHEVSHVAHGDSFRLDSDLANTHYEEGVDEIERRANREAAATLIPPDAIKSFILRKRPYFSAKSIIQFANKIRVHPGIIVGQLHFHKAIKYTHHQKMLVQIRVIVTETAIKDGW